MNVKKIVSAYPKKVKPSKVKKVLATMGGIMMILLGLLALLGLVLALVTRASAMDLGSFAIITAYGVVHLLGGIRLLKRSSGFVLPADKSLFVEECRWYYEKIKSMPQTESVRALDEDENERLTRYSLEELFEAFDNVDRELYPEMGHALSLRILENLR